MTNEVAADLLVQAFHQKYETVADYPYSHAPSAYPVFKSFPEVVEKYAWTAERVKYWGRISDLKEADEKYVDSVVLAYTYGLMCGKSDGLYTKTRTLKPKSKVTVSDAKLYVTRLANSKKRIKLSEDGQVCRTTNLPKNSADLKCVLEAFPNAYYEMLPAYRAGGHTPSGKKDAIQTSKYYQFECEDMYDYQRVYEDKIKGYLEAKLNVNYKTIGSKWKKNILSFYEKDAYYKDTSKGLDKYIKAVKSNKVIVEAKKVVVDWNSIYSINIADFGDTKLTSADCGYSGGTYFRCYVEYTVKSAKNVNGTILFEGINNKTYKKGKVYKAYVDVPCYERRFGEIWIGSLGTIFVNTSNVPKLTKSVYKYPYKKYNQKIHGNCSYIAYPFIMKCFDETVYNTYNNH